MEFKNFNESSDKTHIRHLSGVSTLCDSPQDLKFSPKKPKNKNFDARRYSLPLAKIIIQAPQNLLENHFESPKVLIIPKIPEKLLKNDRMLEKFQEIKSFNPRDTFLNHSQYPKTKNLEFNKLKNSDDREKIPKKYSNSKNHKPSRFLPIHELNSFKRKPRINLKGKSFEQDLNLVIQNKYEKVKADFQMEKILHLRAQTRQSPFIKSIESEWKWRTPDCTPKSSKVVHF